MGEEGKGEEGRGRGKERMMSVVYSNRRVKKKASRFKGEEFSLED